MRLNVASQLRHREAKAEASACDKERFSGKVPVWNDSCGTLMSESESAVSCLWNQKRLRLRSNPV